MGLKSEKLRPFWLSLSQEEKQQYEQVAVDSESHQGITYFILSNLFTILFKLCEILLPSNQALPSQSYVDAIQRALRMSQSRLIPFFGIFLR